jgi:hypothetical protein
MWIKLQEGNYHKLLQGRSNFKTKHSTTQITLSKSYIHQVAEYSSELQAEPKSAARIKTNTLVTGYKRNYNLTCSPKEIAVGTPLATEKHISIATPSEENLIFNLTRN